MVNHNDENKRMAQKDLVIFGVDDSAKTPHYEEQKEATSMSNNNTAKQYERLDNVNALQKTSNYNDSDAQDDVEKQHPEVDPNAAATQSKWAKFKSTMAFLGPAWIVAMAYLDPGNLEGDLSAGALRDPNDPERGYRLLWVLFWATLAGFTLQRLAIKLGTTTGKDLATLCRLAFPRWLSVGIWIVTELCLIGADSQAVIGSAIAFKLLFNLPLQFGIAITLMDTFLILLVTCMGTRKLEGCFAILISFMGVCFFINMFTSKPDAAAIARGLAVVQVPSGTIEFAVALIGCIIMPHNFFLQSSVVQARPINRSNPDEVKRVSSIYCRETFGVLVISMIVNIAVVVAFANPNISVPNGDDGLDLYNAHYALESALGKSTSIVWGLGLLAAGMCSTMAGTYCGQFVMEGLLGIRIKRLWMRVLVTRLITIVPLMFLVLMTRTTVEAISNGVNMMQAFLLPFIVVFLVKFSTSTELMGVHQLSYASKVLAYICGVFLIAINIAFVITLVGIDSIALYVILVVYIVLLGLLWWKRVTFKSSPSFDPNSLQSKKSAATVAHSEDPEPSLEIRS